MEKAVSAKKARFSQPCLNFWCIGLMLLLSVTEGSCKRHHSVPQPSAAYSTPSDLEYEDAQLQRQWWMLFEVPLLSRIVKEKVRATSSQYDESVWGIPLGSRRIAYEYPPFMQNKTLLLTANKLTVSALEAQMFIRALSLREQIAATEAIVRIDQQLLALAEHERESPQLRQIHVFHAQAVLTQAERTLIPLKQQYQQTAALLSAQLPIPPTSQEIEGVSLFSIQPKGVPDSLSSEMLEQRPDMRAAGKNFAQAMDRVGVSMPIQLPHLVITAQAAEQALSAMDMFGIDAYLGSFPTAASLAMPRYHHLIPKKQRVFAVAQYTRALTEYKATVLNALENAADVMIALQQDKADNATNQATTWEGDRALQSTIRELRTRGGSLQACYAIEVSFQQARVAGALATAQRISDAAALFYVIGGWR